MALKEYAIVYGGPIVVAATSMATSRYVTDPFFRLANKLTGSFLDNSSIGALHFTVGYGSAQLLSHFMGRERDEEGVLIKKKFHKTIYILSTVAAGAAVFHFAPTYMEPWIAGRNALSHMRLDNADAGALYMGVGFGAGFITTAVTTSLKDSAIKTKNTLKKFFRG